MHDEREGYLEILSRITTEEEFFSLVLEICGNYGFEFFSFGARAPFPLTAPKYHFLSNYPGEWKSRYISEDYTSIDPIVRHGLLEYTPLIWNGEDFQENRFFWEEALHHGIRHGWSIPVRGKYGLISMLSLVRSSESIAATEILEKESFLLWITSMLQATFGDLLAPRIVPESNVRRGGQDLRRDRPDPVDRPAHGEIPYRQCDAQAQLQQQGGGHHEGLRHRPAQLNRRLVA